MYIQDNIKSQYKASLEMLRQAIELCPQPMWTDTIYRNVFWRLAYHTLFYTHFYLCPGPQDFVPWTKSRKGYHELVPGGEAYSKAEIIEYLDLCCLQVVKQVDAMDPEAPSGFHWLPMDRLGVQMYNIRHIQQHTGELCERLGVSCQINIDWIIQKTE
jgi:hypothetical protein